MDLDDLTVGSEAAATAADGRTIAYREYGDPDGAPVLFHHGTPGSRILPAAFHEIAREASIQLLAPDRPGQGRSDPAPDADVLDWADDAAAVADDAGADRFAALGFSGGGRFALACAHEYPDRVTRVATVAADGPPGAPTDGVGVQNRFLDVLARRAPPLLRLLFAVQARTADRTDPEDALALLTDAERDALDDRLDAPPIARLVALDLREAFRQGHGGVSREFRASVREWPFDLADVEAPVRLRHGADDRNVSPATAEYLAARLPDADAAVLPDEDHLSALVACHDATLSWLAEPLR
ncbi:alpha/beta hydrolase [Natronoarchaeum mannanilyticum]|uniref:Alpha/beta hydrolase n=2 Tax=Natronoarchaeum mannanilyticum TaxID=926360 RepID=A0AAV3T8L2_9EURY